MDPVAELGTEDVVDQLVLGDAAEAGKGWAFNHRLEVMAVAADGGSGPGDFRLDAALQFIWRNGHGEKVSAQRRRRYTE